MMRHIIIGIRGQIGTCVHTFLNGVNEWDVVGVEYGDRVVEGEHFDGGEYGMMHVCIPYYSYGEFIEAVSFYMGKYASKHVVIYSTVEPGVSEALGVGVCHSPVEGRHPNLVAGFRVFRRLVSGRDAVVVGDYYRKWGLEVETFDRCVVTELGKLLSTTRYGLSILFAAEEEKLCHGYGVKFEDVVLAYQRMYNNGYRKLNEDRFIQPMIVPPEGNIKGHCIVPNAKILQRVTEHPWVKDLADYNSYEI